ncbi:hypothetical protein P152DRAFT_404366 [Eremomyces bilateralis CBS 781.70]|uniref:Methyltransferase type 11 domain-containing protein n=1 Tax=Eremomyces bilateralis CBS 781.70 TaxID=1392243 RepID=A0A6G1FTJ2_9PEZI|nr:uncharacterized protein P152DRAFT_404366 [Eremomyces bilateralis CBS 781.70]KAF1808981.1 hypothetical protein P152DRAFT_404366 [Eremomyces bilateralis CBS 781.70]
MQTSYCGVPGFSVKYRSHGLTLSPLAEGPQPTPPPKNALRPAGFTRKNSRGQEYDALYDSSDSEFEDVPLACSRSVKASRQGHQANGSTSTTSTDASGRKVRNYPSLVIPSPSMWPTIEKLRSATSPNSKSRIVPPSPSHILSPTARALNMIAAKNALVPNGSAAPSLDGSLTSEELSGISCPSTPDVGNDAKPDDAEWAGTVQLGPEAMETLQRFRLGSFNEHSEDDEDQVIEIRGEMRESHLENGGMATSINLIVTPVDSEPEDFFPTLSNPGSDLDPLSALSVPSPGGFFGSLNGNARNTWGQGAGDAVPNTSTAISFYGVPWKKSRENSPERTVERVIEVDIDGSSDNDTTGPPTARRLPGTDGMTLGGEAETGNQLRLITDFSGEFEYNPAYAAEQHKENSSHIDRTNLWLYSQEHYLAGLRGDIPTMTNGDDSPIVGHLATGTDEPRKSSLGNASTTLSPSKSVRFADDPEITAGIDGSPRSSRTTKSGPRPLSPKSPPAAAFSHRKARNEALRLGRTCLPQKHRDIVAGVFSLEEREHIDPKRPISAWHGANSDAQARKAVAKELKERHALDQIKPISWNLEATKMLNGGSLLTSPAAREFTSLNKHARKVLDLGGKATADWAWQVAIEYPRVGVWTACVNESPLNKKNDASLLKGPPNHHEIKIPNLWTLPFPDNSFDVVSARSLYSILKTTIPPQGSKLQDSSSTTAPNDSSTTMTANGQGMKRTPGTPPARPLDEYDRALLEVHRVLKPGGYVEFALLDADIIGGGPITQKLSVEFAFNLRTRGYDPAATQGFLSRVRRSGFKRLRRAWIILPMSGVGAPEREARSWDRDRGAEHGREATPDGARERKRACDIGTTVDASYITGLVGAWAWEQWMLKLHTEMGREGEQLLEGVAAALEEGARMGGSWRYLSGWARKDL